MSTRWRAAVVTVTVLWSLACFGEPDLGAVPATASPDFGTTTTYTFQDLEIPVGAGRPVPIDHRSMSVAYDDGRDMHAEMARYDAWATAQGFTLSHSDRVPLESQLVYERSDKRLVLKFGWRGLVRISTVP